MQTPSLSSSAEQAAVLTHALGQAATRLRISPAELGAIIGVSPSTASRLMQGKSRLRASTKEWELSVLVVKLYRASFSLVGGDDDLAQEWLHAPNHAFAQASPIDVIKRVDGLLHVCEYLDAYCARI